MELQIFVIIGWDSHSLSEVPAFYPNQCWRDHLKFLELDNLMEFY